MNLQMSSQNRTRWKDQELEQAPELLNLSWNPKDNKREEAEKEEAVSSKGASREMRNLLSKDSVIFSSCINFTVFNPTIDGWFSVAGEELSTQIIQKKKPRNH